MRYAALLLLLLPTTLWALPDLDHQEAWGDKEKKEFLQYLRSGQGAATDAQNKSVKTTAPAGGYAPARKPRFLTLSFATDSVITVPGNGYVRREGTGFGPKILVGAHLFTWLRYYGGAEFTRFDQQLVDGSKALVTHLQFPVGLEVALVPLGTAQTQYLLLRGGVALHSFEASHHSASDFRSPLLGQQTSVNAGLGYEWQIPDTRWRINTLMEGYKYLARQGSTARFYGLGFTLGTVYTF